MDERLSRRCFLRSTALSGAGIGALLWSSGRAAAFTEHAMDAQTHALYLSACSAGADTRAYHQKLLAEAKTELAATMSGAEIEAALAQLTCPICGCPLAS